MTAEQIIEGILDREGEGTPPYLDPDDAGGRTSWGISERWYPEEWKPGPPSKERARIVLTQVYLAPFSFVRDVGCDERLLAQLVDFAVNSGIEESLLCLCRVLDVSNVTMAVNTQNCKAHLASRDRGHDRHIAIELLAERFVFEHRLTQSRPPDKKYEDGWDTRVASFYW